MTYNIIKCIIEFKDNELCFVTVFVEACKGDIRQMYADTKPRFGYMHIKKGQQLNAAFLQEVAAYGMQLN